MNHHTNDPTIKCCCGSGLPTEDIYDARGIFIIRVCKKCKKEKLSGFRPEIFENNSYTVNEQINSD